MEGNHEQQLKQFYQRTQRMPTYAEMMKLFGFKSKNAVYRVVEKLKDAGVIAKDHLGRLVPSKLFNEIPLVGLVKAGFPAAVDEELKDTMSLDDFLVEKKEATYVFEVDGDSMIEAHIEPGDLVIAERTNKAKNGDIVIAEVDGEWTMKYFRQKGERVWLEPANKNYQPIYPEHDLKVTAIVKGVVRKY